MVSLVPPSGHQTANKQWMKYGALSDWHMIFRKDVAEAPQHLAFETLMKKRFENEGRRGKVQLSENLERSSSTLSPFTCKSASWRFSYCHCSKREEHLGVTQCNSPATYLALQQHSAETMFTVQTTETENFIILTRTTQLWSLMSSHASE